VFVISDHGFRANPELAWGDHRAEGIWIAAGPGIRPNRERVTMSVLSVTPTVLAALGMPVAADMDGPPRSDVLESAEPRTIATYETREHPVTPAKQIDASMVDQLRSLGYVK
jgi:arylsulfatase A-like enzyme